MTIEINSLEYQCWHEVGHATICLHLGGDVAVIELLNDEHAAGLARARCNTTPDIKPRVACGGFAIEFFLFRAGQLPKIDDHEITQIIFRNATKDREMFAERILLGNDEFTKEEDVAFMHCAIDQVAPIFKRYFLRMRELVDELLATRRVDGEKVKAVLMSQRA